MNTYGSLLLFACMASGLSVAAAADDVSTSEERTSMPAYCSERDVNCVLEDGGPTILRAVPSGRATTPGVTPNSGISQGAGTIGATPGGGASGTVRPGGYGKGSSR